MSTVFNIKPVNYLEQPMFFGEELNVARADIQKYPIFEKLTDMQHGYFWRPDEIAISKDSIDFKEMSEHERFIFLANLKYQTLVDSFQGRGPTIALQPYLSLPELEPLIVCWAFFETIHSRSYQHILRNLESSKVSEIFDSIVLEPAIIERAKSIAFYYDDFIEYASYYKLLGFGIHTIMNVNGQISLDINEYELKKKLFLLIISINALEGVRFYASFACSFAFAELKKMEGNSKIIALIARDEFQHLAITQNIIKNWKRKTDDAIMSKVIDECEYQVYKIYEDIVEQEKEWAKYIFQHGSIVGLNSTLLCNFVEFKANERLKTIGYHQKFKCLKNPLGWINKYLNSETTQVAPQETEIISYKVGAIDMNVNDSDFNEISL